MTDSSLDTLVRRLRTAGCVYAEEEAALLVAGGREELDERVARRVAGEPLEQVLGWAEFDGRRILVRPGVFVPRQRSVLLVAAAADQLRRLPTSRAGIVVDLCCGSGAIAAAVAARVPQAEVYAADVDPLAVACARLNLGPDRVFEGDLYDALPPRLRGSIDVLAVNAPYVPSDELAFMPREARLYEPRSTLDGGADGLDWHRRIAVGARDWLRADGVVLIETSRRQAPTTCAILVAAGFEARIETSPDLDATIAVARTA